MKQTLLEFIDSPFFLSNNLKNGVNELEKKFLDYDKLNKIKLASISNIDNLYYYHFKVPSETHPDLYYDVVLEFSSDDTKLVLPRYNIRLFSNAPSFIYKYSSLYAKNDMLIKDLYDKIGKDNLDKMPEKSNSSMELNYDKTLYYACRYLKKHKILMMNKAYFKVFPQTKYKIFIDSIGSVATKNSEIEVSRTYKQVEKSLDKMESINKKEAHSSIPSGSRAKPSKQSKITSLPKVKANAKLQKRGKQPKK